MPDGAHSTLFFMPHCEQFLYDAVLAANMRRLALPRVVLVGNSFAEYAERDALKAADPTRSTSLLIRLQAFVTGTAHLRSRCDAGACATNRAVACGAQRCQ